MAKRHPGYDLVIISRPKKSDFYVPSDARGYYFPVHDYQTPEQAYTRAMEWKDKLEGFGFKGIISKAHIRRPQGSK